MLRPIAKLASALFLLASLLQSHPAMAVDFGPGSCQASDSTSLAACVAAVKAGTAQKIVITAMIECSGPSECKIDLESTNVPAGTAVTISGYPLAPATTAGLHRTGGFGYGLIKFDSLSNVTIKNFTIQDAPPPGTVLVDGERRDSDGNLILDANGQPIRNAISCAGAAPGSTVSNPRVHQIMIAATDQNVPCPVPGYVSSGDNTSTGISDSNATCFAALGHVANCSSAIIVSNGSHVTISGMTIENTVGAGVNVSHLTGFNFLNNHVSNVYDQGLWISSSTDVSIEGNYFFATRGAAMNITIDSSDPQQPSDIYDNTFNHDQHGDAFECNHSEGCSGGQLGITGSDFVFYGNTFLNGFTDFYDPAVMDQQLGYDAFSDCDLSSQCNYYPVTEVYTGPTCSGSASGSLWMCGGGVETGPDYQGVPNGGRQDTPDVEITDPVSGNAIFSNNRLDAGSWAFSYDKYDNTKPVTQSGFVQIYNNEMISNALGEFKWPMWNYETNTCSDAAGCGAPDVTSPTILEEKPGSAAEERSHCGSTNCIWLWVTEAWDPSHSLALGSGNPVQCALQIFGPGGSTLLATVQGADASCAVSGPLFTVPASVAQHYTQVQIAFKNLSTGQVSPKQLVSLPGMTPTITSVGTTTCANGPCAWVDATDAVAGRGNCAVGIYTTSGTHITTLTGSAVTCASTQATFYIPASVLNNYAAVDVNYQNLVQGTWSGLSRMTIPGGGSGGGGGGGGGGGVNCGGTTGIICP